MPSPWQRDTDAFLWLSYARYFHLFYSLCEGETFTFYCVQFSVFSLSPTTVIQNSEQLTKQIDAIFRSSCVSKISQKHRKTPIDDSWFQTHCHLYYPCWCRCNILFDCAQGWTLTLALHIVGMHLYLSVHLFTFLGV